MGMRQCEVCKKEQAKYKCPSCLVPYCSLSCFKKHKEVPCNKPSALVEELAAKVLPGGPCLVDRPDWVLRNEQLQCIAESSEICKGLKNNGLRKLIHDIALSGNPEDELSKAMEDQVLRDFTDKILDIIRPEVHTFKS